MHRPFFIPFICFILLSLNSHAKENNRAIPNPAAFITHLDKATQKRVGIQTIVLKSSALNPEIQHFATLVNLQPLIITRKDYISALSNEKIARIHYLFNQKNVQRALDLQKNNTLSLRKLRAQQLQLEIAKAQITEAQQQTINLQRLIQAQWGNVISTWILNPENKTLAKLSAHQKQLYLIDMPLAAHQTTPIIFLQPFGQREKALTAHLVSYAPLNNQALSSKSTFYYLTETSFNTSAQRPIAWIPTQSNKILGVKIPSTALVWHLGQAFVYVQHDEDYFWRIPLNHKQLIDTQHYFIQNDLQKNDILVTQGTQLLLSEEFRAQIPAEDDDD